MEEEQYLRFIEDAARHALNKAGIDKDGLQKLIIENGDMFQKRILAAIRELSVSSLYNNEEIESKYGYFGYNKPKSIAEQVALFRQLFPGIGLANEKLVRQPLPANAEGWFAIPRWQLVGETYEEALLKVLDLIKQQHEGRFYNWRKGRIGEQNLRQHEHTAKMLQILSGQQTGFDILVVAAQFGFRHRGRSARRACAVFAGNEYGLGAFEVGCMILTHPERLAFRMDLSIDCSGDKYAPFGDGDFSGVPCFIFNSGEIQFDVVPVDNASESFGSVSAFLPQ
jgi:hypothetical protein